MNLSTLQRWTAFCILLLFAAGCQSTYYSVWEKLGKEKRHLLKDQVEKQKEEQKEASEQFKDALTRVKEIYGFDGGDLEEVYDDLKDEYEECEERAEAVESRIDRVETIARDLFIEWGVEIKEISNAKFKAQSKKSLKQTKKRYDRLQKMMMKAHARMTPVLQKLKDYVLYLKHNLNAQAIGALKNEVVDIESDVNKLIEDIQKSIKEADDFLKTLE